MALIHHTGILSQAATPWQILCIVVYSAVCTGKETGGGENVCLCVSTASVRLCACLSVSICLYVGLPACLSVSPSVHPLSWFVGVPKTAALPHA